MKMEKDEEAKGRGCRLGCEKKEVTETCLAETEGRSPLAKARRLAQLLACRACLRHPSVWRARPILSDRRLSDAMDELVQG